MIRSMCHTCDSGADDRSEEVKGAFTESQSRFRRESRRAVDVQTVAKRTSGAESWPFCDEPAISRGLTGTRRGKEGRRREFPAREKR